jgi:hypothetical protein
LAAGAVLTSADSFRGVETGWRWFNEEEEGRGQAVVAFCRIGGGAGGGATTRPKPAVALPSGGRRQRLGGPDSTRGLASLLGWCGKEDENDLWRTGPRK